MRSYALAEELTSLNGDRRTYNILGQLTRISGGGIDLEYVYTAGQNNGRIAQQIDHVSGEQVTYQYDQLNRLSHAETLDNSWGYTYSYDGFGNLTGKIVTKGTAIPGMTGFTAAYDPATNHGSGYDANGNAPVNGECPNGGCYDVENRLRTPFVAPSWGFYILGFGNYVYDPWGKRVAWRNEAVSESGLEVKCELYIYGISGQRVASYGCGYQAQDGGGSVFQWTLKGYNVYFAGHMIQSNGVSVTTDRLGSVRKNGNSETFKYLPYGEELTSTADGREKFATYLRDSGVGTEYGLDYADQRYYDRGSGRFLTVDPGGISTADPRNPGSWNRYAYVNGDPVNFNDSTGLVANSAEFGASPYVILNPTPVDPDPPVPPPPVPPLPIPIPPPPTHPQCNDTRAVTFIQEHLDDATQLAAQLQVPVEFVLAVSADESQFGTSPIAKRAHNYFGVHAGGINSTGTFKTDGGAFVSSYNGVSDPYFASGMRFCRYGDYK